MSRVRPQVEVFAELVRAVLRADTLLDTIVAAVRRRLLDAAIGTNPIILASGAVAVCELQGTHRSVSAGGPSSVIRGAAVSLAVGADE